MRKPVDLSSIQVPKSTSPSEFQSLCITFGTNLGSYSTSTLVNAGVRSIASSTVVWSTVWTPERKQWRTGRTIECDGANLGNANLTPTLLSRRHNSKNHKRQFGEVGSSHKPPDFEPDGDPEKQSKAKRSTPNAKDCSSLTVIP